MSDYSLKVSIVITTFNRASLLAKTLESFVAQRYPSLEVVVADDGFDTETPKLCKQEWPFDLRYFKVRRPASKEYRNPGPVTNFAVKRATGDILIIQNAECVHVGNVIEKLVAAVKPNNAAFAHVEYLSQTGKNQGVLRSHDIEREGQGLFFCGAIYADWYHELQGMDEDFVLPSCEDNDFSHRMKAAGLTFVYLKDAIVHHQWHSTAGIISAKAINESQTLLRKKLSDMKAGRINWIRNPNGWGNLLYEE